MSLREDALGIIRAAIAAADPGANTERAVRGLALTGPVTAFAIGKAAAPMAAAAERALGDRLRNGFLITKYGHAAGFSSPRFEVLEAGHPVSDENSERAARRAMEAASALTARDTALVLLSGGGSAVFEAACVPPAFQRRVTEKLLARGAGIEEMNAVRKRLSLVKGGRFAALCAPARVVTVALSDVLSNDPGAIASGPTVRDIVPEAELRRIWNAYLYDETLPAAACTPPPEIPEGEYLFAGNVETLCAAAKARAEALGYRAECPAARLTGEAREQPARLLAGFGPGGGRRALLCGGETTVTLRGAGRGGRNQEMALAAAIALRGRRGILFASAGSDGTDGPTDAAGGLADGGSFGRMLAAGVDPAAALENNDSYAALSAAGDLIVTGPTGTNVNDLTLILTE